MKFCVSLLLPCGLLLGLPMVTSAQTKKPLPTLTTDDVVAARPAPPPAAPAKESGSESGKNVGKEEPRPASVKATEAAASGAEAKKSAEKGWNDRLRQAQEKARVLTLQADQTELQITQLRNQLFSASTRAPEANGQMNNQIAALSAQTNRLRAEAKAAQQSLEALQAEGRDNQYSVQSVALTNEKGEPDQAAYQGEQDKLQGELQAAQARSEVLQLRLRNNQAETLKKASGDNFALNRLREEREQITAELEKTRQKIAELNIGLSEHRGKATAVGLPVR